MASYPRSLVSAVVLGLAVFGAAVFGVASSAPAWAGVAAAKHIVVNASNLNRSYSCGSGDSVTVNGHNDKLQFTDTCSTLTLTSTADDIEVNKVSSITFTSTSAGNTVCWEHGSPAVHNSGIGNSVGACS
jgi:hypothetical protein